MSIIISLVILLLSISSLSYAVVPVVRSGSGASVLVCQPNDTGAGCTGVSGGGSNYWLNDIGNVGINTTYNVGIGTINASQALTVYSTNTTLASLQSPSQYAFPSSSVLDTFTRANSSTTLGSNWTKLSNNSTWGSDNLGISSNKAYDPSGAEGGWWYWNVSSFSGTIEGYVTLSVISGAGSDGVLFLASGVNSGYAITTDPSNTTSILVYKFSASALTLIKTISQSQTNGDSLGGTIDNLGNINVYYKVGSGAWTQIGTVNDTTYTPLYLAIAEEETTVRMTNFGGGVASVTGSAFEQFQVGNTVGGYVGYSSGTGDMEILRGNGSTVNLASNATSGNTGIGQASPTSTLDVNGGESIGSSYSGVNTAPSNGLAVQGNVGIGSSNPGQSLDVNGNVRMQGLIATNASSINTFAGNVAVGTTTASSQLVIAGDGAGNGGVGIGTNSGSAYVTTMAGAGNLIVENNVGIGTVSPQGQLEIGSYSSGIDISMGSGNISLYCNNSDCIDVNTGTINDVPSLGLFGGLSGTSAAANNYGSPVHKGNYLFNISLNGTTPNLLSQDISSGIVGSLSSITTNISAPKKLAIDASWFGFVANSGNGTVSAYNLSRPKLMVALANPYSTGITAPTDLCTTGNLLSITDPTGGLVIVDKSDPTHMKFLASTTTNISSPTAVYCAPNMVDYVVGAGYMTSVDISKAGTTHVLTVLQKVTSHISTPVDVTGNDVDVFIADTTNGIVTYQIPKPTAMTYEAGASVNTPFTGATAVDTQGEFLFAITDSGTNLYMFNIQGSTSISQLSTANIIINGYPANGFCVVGNNIFVAAGNPSVNGYAFGNGLFGAMVTGSLLSGSASIGKVDIVNGEVNNGYLSVQGGANFGSDALFSNNLSVNGNAIVNSNVGIGTNNPQGALTIMNGNVGIGTWIPTSTVQVAGTCGAVGPVGACWTSTGQLGYCSGALGVCSTCTAC